MNTYYCLVFAVLQRLLVISQGESTLTITDAGNTAKFDCASRNADIPAEFFVYKDSVKVYDCIDISFTCRKFSADSEYTDILFTGLGSPLAKGTFTVTNPSETRDGGIWKCQFGSSQSDGKPFPVIDTTTTAPTTTAPTATASTRTKAVLSVQNVVEGGTATFACTSSIITNTTSLEIKKDGMLIYNCGNIVFTCSAVHDIDYSDVTFTGIGTTSGKGTFTVDNTDQARDGGIWVCEYGSSLESDPVTFVVKETNDVKEKLPFMAMAIPLGVLVIVFFIVTRHKTLAISTLYVKVSKNTVQLSWKLFGFEPVPDTLYAKCAQNGLTENAEFIDGLFVVVFRDLVPGQQHDVTVYCQNAADMKLYKSETCVVFTLKDSSNTNPKESKAVLALHSLDLTVYQTKVELSWTSPLAFDSTKVEYWVGSDKHITMSADKTSLATSNAEMTRLLPDSVITFTITGEKNGTQYRSGVLHQKTLKGLTG